MTRRERTVDGRAVEYRRERYVECPACGFGAVTRLHRRCRRCRVLLVLPGEYFFREDNEPVWTGRGSVWNLLYATDERTP
jgi:hypothetical protein